MHARQLHGTIAVDCRQQWGAHTVACACTAKHLCAACICTLRVSYSSRMSSSIAYNASTVRGRCGVENVAGGRCADAESAVTVEEESDCDVCGSGSGRMLGCCCGCVV